MQDWLRNFWWDWLLLWHSAHTTCHVARAVMLGVFLGPFLWDLKYSGSFSPNLQKLGPAEATSAKALSTASASRFLLFPLKSFLCAKLLFCFHFLSLFSCSYNLHHGLLCSFLPGPVFLTYQSSLDSLVPSSQQNPTQGTKHHCQPSHSTTSNPCHLQEPSPGIMN